jgi:hypothetical protein
MKNFFNSKLYHNNERDRHLPIFSILSDDKDFGVESVVGWKKSHKLKNLFIICNGQQTLPFPGDVSSIHYGFKLAGIWIEQYRKYKIERSGSLASDLYDEYHDNSIVLDIVDCKFNWEESILSNTIPLEYTSNLVEEIIGKDRPKIFIVGFSRGATFSIKLIERLKGRFDVNYFYSIDPVVATWKEEIVGYAKKDKDIWTINLPAGMSFTFTKEKQFPILKNPNPVTKIYNIFQRRALFKARFKDWYNCPIGCAIDGAFSYDGAKNVIDQYDMDATNHFDLREGNMGKVLGLIQDVLNKSKA